MESGKSTCSICLQTYDSEDSPWRLSCGHILCSNCMDESLFEENRCSNCLTKMHCTSTSSRCSETSLKSCTGNSRNSSVKTVQCRISVSSVSVETMHHGQGHFQNVNKLDPGVLGVEASSVNLPLEQEIPQGLDTPEKMESFSHLGDQEVKENSKDIAISLSHKDKCDGEILRLKSPDKSNEVTQESKKEKGKITPNVSSKENLDAAEDSHSSCRVVHREKLGSSLSHNGESFDESSEEAMEANIADEAASIPDSSIVDIPQQKQISSVSPDKKKKKKEKKKKTSEVSLEDVKAEFETTVAPDSTSVDVLCKDKQSIYSKGKLDSNSYPFLDINKDIGVLDFRITLLREMQIRVTELMNKNQGLTTQESPTMSLKVTDRQFKGEEHLREIDRMILNLENLKMEAEFAELSSDITKAKDEVSMVQAFVKQHIDEEFETNRLIKLRANTARKNDSSSILPSVAGDQPTGFTPLLGEDNTRHFCITAMDECKNQSLEELRLQHYLKQERHPLEARQMSDCTSNKRGLDDPEEFQPSSKGSFVKNDEHKTESFEELRLQHCHVNLDSSESPPHLTPQEFSPNSIISSVKNESLHSRRMKHRESQFAKRVESSSDNVNNNQNHDSKEPIDVLNPFSALRCKALTKYNPVVTVECNTVNGRSITNKVCYQSICSMEEYAGISFEELRVGEKFLIHSKKEPHRHI